MTSFESQPFGTGPFFLMAVLHFRSCTEGTLRSVRLALYKKWPMSMGTRIELTGPDNSYGY